MGNDIKILAKNTLGDKFESGDLGEMSNRELKNMVSDILAEKLGNLLENDPEPK